MRGVAHVRRASMTGGGVRWVWVKGKLPKGGEGIMGEGRVQGCTCCGSGTETLGHRGVSNTRSG